MFRYAIWGYGKIGHKFLESDYAQSNRLVAIIDNAQCHNVKTTDNIPVINSDDFFDTYINRIDCLIVTMADIDVITDIVFEIKDKSSVKLGIVKNNKLHENCQYMEDDVFWLHDDKAFIGQMEMAGSEKCNLNCRACSHYCTAQTKQKAINQDRLKITLAELKKKSDILTFYITGGEPLLNPDLNQLVQVLSETLTETDIKIVSNGLLVDRQNPELWDCMRKYNITFQMSGYPPTLKMKDRIIDILSRYGVRYQFKGDVSFFYALLSNKDDNNPIISEKHCLSYRCRYLDGTRIYKCPESHLIVNLNKMYPGQVNIRPDDGVDVFDKDFYDKIRRLNNPIPMCSHCAEHPKKVRWERQKMNPEVDDWFTD